MQLDLSANRIDINADSIIQNNSAQSTSNLHSTQELTFPTKRPVSSNSSIYHPDKTPNTKNQNNSSPSQINTQVQQSNNEKLATKLLESGKTLRPSLKKPKRSNSIEQIIIKLDQTLELAKTEFKNITNLKINFTQLKFII